MFSRNSLSKFIRRGGKRRQRPRSASQSRPALEVLEDRTLMSVTEFPIPAGDVLNARPEGITRGPDGNLWFTENFGGIGRITTAGVVTRFTAGLSPNSVLGEITAGPDGNLWFTDAGTSRIGRITPAGVITEFSAGITAGSRPGGITRGPDGNLWFAEVVGNKIGRITPAGVVTEFSAGITQAQSNLGFITAGPDGNLWFGENAGKIGRITPAGAVTEFSAGLAAGEHISGITTGPDGNLWFTELLSSVIGRITPAGVITEVIAVTPGANPLEITTGPDGNLWFTEAGGSARIGRLTTAGALTEFAAGITTASSPFGIAAGPDGNIWFAEGRGTDVDHIGRLNLAQSPAETTTTLRASATTIPVGQTLTLTATVTALGGGAVTNGRVDFYNGNTPVGFAFPDTNGVATIDLTAVAPGSAALRAVLVSRAFPASTSAVVAVTVTADRVATTVSLAASVNPATVGNAVVFTATVAAVTPGAGTPTGTVTFKDGSVVLATSEVGADGTVSIKTPFAAAGGHVITAVYSGDGSFAGSSQSLTEQVNAVATPAVTATFSAADGRLTVAGDGKDNTIVVSRDAAGTILVNNGAVEIKGGPATVANTGAISISGGAGNDNLSLDEANGPLPRATMTGDDGNDTLTGGSGNDSLSGGSGDDNVIGGKGNDTIVGNGGNDTFVWNDGDGNDLIDGVLNDVAGTDRLVVNGSNLAEKFAISADGNAAQVTRDVGNVTLDLVDVEIVDVNAFGGADTITMNDVSVPDIKAVNLDVGSAGDGAADAVIVNGTAGNDSMSLSIAPLRVIGLPTTVSLANLGSADSLTISGGGGDDNIVASSILAGTFRLTENGQAGNDTLTGSRGDDTLNGGDGDDFILGFRGNDSAFMGAGNDTFEWDPGDGSDTLDGQAGSDTMQFVGSNDDENFDVAANGNHVRFLRTLANTNVNMDLDGVEEIDLSARGGADAVAVNHLTGTDVTSLHLDLDGAQGTGAGDGARDSVTVNGRDSADVIPITGTGGLVFFGGPVGAGSLPYSMTIAGSEGANDTLTVNTLAGDDRVDASSLPAGLIGLSLNGGTGNDTLVGSAGGDLIDGGDGNDSLIGGAGNDVLGGGAGNDTYGFDADVALGADTITEGGGVDTLDFSATATRAVNANLGTRQTQVVNAGLTLTLSAGDTIENVIGGSLGDTLVGNALNNSLTGGPGDDVLSGGAGSDTYRFDTDLALGSDKVFESGGGTDTLDFSATTTRSVRVNLGTRQTQVVNAGLTLTLSSASRIENVVGGALDDTLVGNSLNNVLTGGAGNDTLDGRGGFDTLDGGAGTDTGINGEVLRNLP